MKRAALLLALAGCGDNLAATPDAACVPVAGSPALGLQLVASGLARPVAIASPPGDPRLFVVEQDGRVRIVLPAMRDAPFLALDGLGTAEEQGLLSIAFHPDYAQNGRLFVGYARGADDALVVEAWRVSSDPDRADPASRRVLLEIGHSEPIHYGAMLAFDGDGLLHVSSGDGGPQRDPEGHAQDLASLRGKVLRIDVDHGDPYAIPDGNPFGNEVWAYGVRNPWRFAIDPVTQDLVLADVGDDLAEELDVIPAGVGGLDFGWPRVEGDACLDPDGCDGSAIAPVYEYSHLLGCAVVGGPVYRGCRMPGYQGAAFFGDYCGGWIRSLRDGAVTVHAGLQLGSVSALGTDAAGELYVADHVAGTVSRIVPVE